MNRTSPLIRLISLVLTLSLLSFAFVPVPAEAVKVSCQEFSGSNQLSDTHNRWGSPVTSHLITVDGGFMRFQANALENGYLVEYFDSAFHIQRTVTVAAELPIYGGFYASGSNYYIVSGQENREESADVECFRITKYDLNWNRLASDGLYDCNTTVPFDAGSVRFAMSGKYLMIRTAHEMYMSDDGYNHQANMTIRLDTETTTILDSTHKVAYTGYGYVSHSFDQFIQMEGDTLVAVDHGDAYPRSIVLTRCETNMSSGSFNHSYASFTQTDLLTFPGGIGDNTTNASIGGFEISNSSYLVAYNYVVNYDESADYWTEIEATRNVFIASMDKTTSEVTLKQITSIADGDTTAGVPHLVKVSDSSFLLLWEQGSTVRYTMLNAEGDPVGQIQTMNGELSDCVPMVYGTNAIWYVWKDNTVIVYEIDLNDLSSRQTYELEYGHDYTVTSYPTSTGGDCTRVCQTCGYTETGSTPSTLYVYWNTDTGNGTYSTMPDRTSFDVGESAYMMPSVGAADMERLSSLTEAYLTTQLERGFQTLDFYKSLLI